jgi:hypothetical protein
MQNRSALAGALEPASSAPAIAVGNDGFWDTAIAAAAGFASSSLRQLHGPRPQLQLLMIDIAD